MSIFTSEMDIYAKNPSLCHFRGKNMPNFFYQHTSGDEKKMTEIPKCQFFNDFAEILLRFQKFTLTLQDISTKSFRVN